MRRYKRLTLEEEADRYLYGHVSDLRLANGEPVPDDMVVVHNHARPTRLLGNDGFRAWVTEPDDPRITLCHCGWAAELLAHFRTTARTAQEYWDTADPVTKH